MEVQLTPDEKAFVRQAIESWRLEREEDAVREALLLWEERERRRLEILVAVDKAEASLARGQGRTVSTRGKPGCKRAWLSRLRRSFTARVIRVYSHRSHPRDLRRWDRESTDFPAFQAPNE
jgi:Arc/MetJ-type ribon-helix-helix transcriptional regulator